MVHNIP